MLQRLLLLLTVFTCGLGTAFAQQSQAPDAKVGAETQARPELRPYLLGPGDVVEVIIYDTTISSRNVQVDSDGYVSSLPFIQPVKALCRTEKQLQTDITAAYARLIKEPQVSVLIREKNSRPPASVFGAVRQATKVPTLRKLRLNEAIAASGGFTEKASGTIQILHTEPVLCPDPGEEADARPIDGTAVPLEVVKIADLQNGANNPLIRAGDLVLVTEAEPVYITGSVVAPGSITMQDQLTLSRALAVAGGPRKEANLSDVRIFRQRAGSTEQEIIKVDFAAIKKNEAPDIVLKPFDVVSVSDGAFGGVPWWRFVIDSLAGGFRVRPIP